MSITVQETLYWLEGEKWIFSSAQASCEWRENKHTASLMEAAVVGGVYLLSGCDQRQTGRCRWTPTNGQVTSAGVEPRVTTAAAAARGL